MRYQEIRWAAQVHRTSRNLISSPPVSSNQSSSQTSGNYAIQKRRKATRKPKAQKSEKRMKAVRALIKDSKLCDHENRR